MMPGGSLSPLQARVLALLADIAPPWTLTGGGAVAGVYFGHRTTRDLDLFWHGAASLGRLRDEVIARLTAAGLGVRSLQTSPAFAQLRVDGADEVVVVDLVADPVAPIEPPQRCDVAGTSVLVDTPHEILVNKLCALLGRSELRDLVDVQALLAAGGDLPRALADAPRKDGGFSPLTLAWVVRGLPIATLAASLGVPAEQAAALERFRDQLVDRVVGLATPASG